MGRLVTGQDGAARVRRLVEGLLTAANIPFQNVDGCLLTYLPAEAMTALEGRWAPAGSLFLAFDRATAADRPEADLVEPGSLRLERFLAWVRRENRLGVAYLPPLPRTATQTLLSRPGALDPESPAAACYLLEETQAWEPHLILGFLAARAGVDRRETLHVPGINLVTGDLRRDWRPDLPEHEGAPAGPLVRRRLPYRRAYQTLLSSVVE
ncbi:MAG TPA: hypothetical protein GXX28_07860, partial [Firmicutes bacterium]|nr:hypothetical protein [Bacillota bacterium]